MFLSILPFLLAVTALTVAAVFRYMHLGARGRRRLGFIVSHLLYVHADEGWRVTRFYLIGSILLGSFGIVAVSVMNTVGFVDETAVIGRKELLGLLMNLFNLVHYTVLGGLALVLFVVRRPEPQAPDTGLVLTRRAGESLRLAITSGVDSATLMRGLRDEGILISFGEIRGDEIKIGIIAPPGIRVLRDEVAAGATR